MAAIRCEPATTEELIEKLIACVERTAFSPAGQHKMLTERLDDETFIVQRREIDLR